MDTLVANPALKTQTTAYQQTNLVSDGFVPARVIDPNLINPWGVSRTPAGPFWVSDNGKGVTTFYDGAGNIVTIPTPINFPIIGVGSGTTVITIATPPGQTTPASPTGQVFNQGGQGFMIATSERSGTSTFIFATEDGTISGWNPLVSRNSSVLAVDNSKGGKGAVYKGLAIAFRSNSNGGNLLYAANFRSGKVEVYNQNFKLVKTFTDHNVPKGYAPFNVQVLDGHLFVTFALQDSHKHDDVAGAGHGFVDEFNLNGKLLHRVASRGPLDSPWGLAIAPTGFGQFSHDLLVGNFGDGTINVFNPNNDKFLGKLRGANGAPIKIGDLWALVPGNANPNTDPKKIYFTAGVQNEAHGLFGSLGAIQTHTTSVTMPSSHVLA